MWLNTGDQYVKSESGYVPRARMHLGTVRMTDGDM